jgi:hypothetical protein
VYGIKPWTVGKYTRAQIRALEQHVVDLAQQGAI